MLVQNLNESIGVRHCVARVIIILRFSLTFMFFELVVAKSKFMGLIQEEPTRPTFHPPGG